MYEMRVSLPVSPSLQCLAQYGMEPGSHDTSHHPLRGGRQRGSIIGGAAGGLYRESACAAVMGHQAGTLYRLLHPASIKTLHHQRHFAHASIILFSFIKVFKEVTRDALQL